MTNFIGDEENVISSLQADTWGLYVTNWRLVYHSITKDGKSRTFRDIDYKYIAHINCESRAGEDYRLFGALLIFLGVVIIALGYYYEMATGALIIGGLSIFGGIVLILTKPEPKSILKIDLSGLGGPVTITMATSASEMDEILKTVAEMREKTTLRHDSARADEI